MQAEPPIHWQKVLQEVLESDDWKNLSVFLAKERSKETIFPEKEKVFQAFKRTAFTDVKVVIVGQDPYHSEGQANGLAFSVTSGMKLAPSLKNIMKELKADVNSSVGQSGDLTSWADQGVFLLNTCLTVREGQPGSHQNHGWERFTDAVISVLSSQKSKIVFILWGKHAQSKVDLIDSNRHLILCAPHPSPFSARKGFFGCKHFSLTNEYLLNSDREPIDWGLG
jgi:uracil-DNA glycosylase